MAIGNNFKINEHVVYPLHGVGLIEEINKRALKGEQKKFYRIKLKDSGMIISIPTENAASMGLRHIIKKEDIKNVIKTLSEYPNNIEENWKLRFQENISKLKTGKIKNIVDVVKELFVRNKTKSLSVMERKQFENAYRMLIKELSISGETNEEEINSIISDKLDSLVGSVS